MTIGHLAPDEVVTVDRETSLAGVAEKFESEKVGSVVITEDNEPVGLLTDRDLALTFHKKEDITSLTAQDVMTEKPVIVQDDLIVKEITRVVSEHNVRRIPVVDENGKLTRIVTIDDLITTISEELDDVVDAIESQSPKYSL